MEQKIEKIFRYFNSIKNEPFYTACIAQVVEIYEGSPQSLKFILFNLHHLVFSPSKQLKLRLKHRLICSSLLAKLLAIYTQRLRLSLSQLAPFELENFQLDSKPHRMDDSRPNNAHWLDLDLLQVVQDEPLLLATAKGRSDQITGDYVEQEKKVFSQFLEMNHATMLNIENAFKDVDTHNQAADQAILLKKLKFQPKIDKYHAKLDKLNAKQPLPELEFTVSNPFNLLYEIALDNLLHTEWELRHMSVLLLKELLAHPDFLGFTHTFSQIHCGSPAARFELLSLTTKDTLRVYTRSKAIVDEVMSRVLRVLLLDRFADYQTDETVIIVRMVAADILVSCYRSLQPELQLRLLRMVKRLFDKDAQLGLTASRDKFTWEVKHSFLYFVDHLLEHRDCAKPVCTVLEESLMKMLGSDQVDEVTLYVCRILHRLLPEPFFTADKVDRVNRQVWAVVETLDDISVSAKQTLALLCAIFPHFKLNEAACVERLRKFFTSKIPEVRAELYRLVSSLFAKRKDIPPATIEKSLVQFLQAAVVQPDKDNFELCLQMGGPIMHYVVKAKNLRKVVEFVNTCVTPNAFTQELIAGKFILGQAELGVNDYLFIYDHENLNCPLHLYTDKRIWKVALALAASFRTADEGLQEVIKGIDNNNLKNHRGKLLTLLLLTKLLPQHKASKLFKEYKEKAVGLLGLEFHDVVDNQIVRVLLPAFHARLKLLLEAEQPPYSLIRALPEHAAHFKVLREIAETLRKVELTSKVELDIGKKLKAIFQTQPEQGLYSQLQFLLSIIEQVIEIQRDLLRHLKLLSAGYVIAYDCSLASELTGLNNLIKPVQQAMREDSYGFISEQTAQAALGLSLSLHKAKPGVFHKFNLNLLQRVSSAYLPAQTNIPEKAHSMLVMPSYMQAVSTYLKLVGQAIPNYLHTFSDSFLLPDPQAPLHEEYLRLLTLLTGTIGSLYAIDNSGQFTARLACTLSAIHAHTLAQSSPSLTLKLTKILSESLVYLATLYSPLSNTFFEWYLSQLQARLPLFYTVLELVAEQNLPELSPVCSLFVVQAVRAISHPILYEPAMNSLSNLIVGVYTNVQTQQLSPQLRQASQAGVEFIKNFKNPANFHYDLRVKLQPEVQLRQYQLQGISWLGFLTKFNLNGALCDDMGLGKTLQVLTLLENEYTLHQHSQDSMIVAPATLMEHWAYEYLKYFQLPHCKVVLLPTKKKVEAVTAKQEQSQQPTLYITNYAALEKTAEGLAAKREFKFLILDEGHVIRNWKTLKSQAVKALKGQHRFILTGTPIQNRLIELWGLFDFLMPGYLYREETFRKHYEKLFEVNLTTFKEDELLFSDAQRTALDRLHFKVMPFIMRRMKGDVLKELPDKIINDYPCELTPLQAELYESFRQDQAKDKSQRETNILASLHRMVQLLNHPYLLGGQQEPRWEDSGKFVALNELFEQFGFTEEDSLLHNKVIIFAKEKATIDLLEKYLQQAHPSTRHLKLTGDTKLSERFTIAQTFNGDFDIKVLLVTKAVGGEGLNLSSANMVVMFDSDYNPTVDMQAIDRAHRIGQRRVLNVFRLITKHTLEDNIMGIQKFKTNLAKAIVNLDNASISNVQASNLPELLENLKDLQDANAINSHMHLSMLQEFNRNAIDTEEFTRKY